MTQLTIGTEPGTDPALVCPKHGHRHQPREHSVPCRLCSTAKRQHMTWHPHGVHAACESAARYAGRSWA